MRILRIVFLSIVFFASIAGLVATAWLVSFSVFGDEPFPDSLVLISLLWLWGAISSGKALFRRSESDRDKIEAMQERAQSLLASVSDLDTAIRIVQENWQVATLPQYRSVSEQDGSNTAVDLVVGDFVIRLLARDRMLKACRVE